MKLGRAWMLFETLRSTSLLRGGPLVSAKLGWSIAAIVVALWSGLCALSYGLVLLLGNWAITGASFGAAWNVELVQFVTATLSVLQDVGYVMVVAVWAIVSLGVLAVAWFLTRFRFGHSA